MSSRPTHAPANAGRLPFLASELAELVPLLEAGHHAAATELALGVLRRRLGAIVGDPCEHEHGRRRLRIAPRDARPLSERVHEVALEMLPGSEIPELLRGWTRLLLERGTGGPRVAPSADRAGCHAVFRRVSRALALAREVEDNEIPF